MLFPSLVFDSVKSGLIGLLLFERGKFVTQSIPHVVADLRISRCFFEVTQLDDSFFTEPVNSWADNPLFLAASQLDNNLTWLGGDDCSARNVVWHSYSS